ncbi:MAG: hypothetical protein NUV80_07480 [Candidatus Berkelbacteria bacterium]|nr:hypothetical protein [Candidatus Berkelbacteria bacterium]
MPNQTYYNPSSFHPQTDPGSVPTGASQGYQWATDRNRYNELADMFQQSQQMDLTKQGMELGEFSRNAPYRQQVEQGKGAQGQALSETAVQAAHANLGKTNQEIAELKQKTEKALIENAKSRRVEDWDAWVEGQKRIVLDQARLKAQYPDWTPDQPLPVAFAASLDPKKPEIATGLRLTNPGAFFTAMAQISPASIEARIKAKEDFKKQAASDASRLAGTKYTADKSTEWHRAATKMAKDKAADQKKWDQELMSLIDKETKGAASVPEQKKLNMMLLIKFSEKQAGAGVGAGTTAAFVPGQGIPVPGAVQVPVTGMEAAETPVDQIMTFKQGKFKKIKKGPDSDSSNWQKVN